MSNDTLLTKEEVAALLKCSAKTVQRNRRRLGAVKIGRLLRFKESKIRQYIDRLRAA